MENLTLVEMNAAYHAIVTAFGNSINTTHDGLTMFVTINSDCNGKNDESGIIFDQGKMSIYEKPACCSKCKCKSALEKLLPVIETAIEVSRL